MIEHEPQESFEKWFMPYGILPIIIIDMNHFVLCL